MKKNLGLSSFILYRKFDKFLMAKFHKILQLKLFCKYLIIWMSNVECRMINSTKIHEINFGQNLKI